MPRVRKFEDDLIIRAYPEGQLIFEGHGLRLLKSRENTDISLIESAIEGKDFVGYVDGIHLEYISKFRSSDTGWISVQENYDNKGMFVDLTVLFFKEITSNEYTSINIPFPLHQDQYLSSDVLPLDDKHLFFSISETNDDMHEEVTRSYILNIQSKEYRCLGDFSYFISSEINPKFIVLNSFEDNSIYHYNFSVDDMNESHEPDLERLEDVYQSSYVTCCNANCVCFGKFSNNGLLDMIIVDTQRNYVSLMERFPQLKALRMSYFFWMSLFTLTQNVLIMIVSDGLLCTVVHIEGGEMKMSEGRLSFFDIRCNYIKDIDLESDFHHDDCVFYGGCNDTGAYGSIQYRCINSDVMQLTNLQPVEIFHDGIACFCSSGFDTQYFFYLKEKKIVILRNVSSNSNFQLKYSQLSVHPEEDNFFVMAERYGRGQNKRLVKIEWECSESKPIITEYGQGGSNFRNIILGLSFSTDYLDDYTLILYVGDTMVLELPPQTNITHCCSFAGDLAAFFCDNAVHFVQLIINGNDVEVQKHITFDYDIEGLHVQLNNLPMVETADHHLFIVHKDYENCQLQYLHCLDWSTGCFLKPILLYDFSNSDGASEGRCFIGFLGDSYLHVEGGIIKVFIEDGVIKTRFFTNDDIPCINNASLNQPNNVVQSATFEAETKSMVLRTYNVEEDPESTNPKVETFYIPSFIAEASIIEFHMPNYQT
ncbi:hypothetical protein PCE1_004922 [Barthelona sp. PCE]